MGELSAGVLAQRRLVPSAALSWALVAAAVRALWLAHQPAIAAWDGAIYHRTAERIARGMGFVDTWNNLPPYPPTAFYPVGYPAILGAGYALLGPHPWVAGVLNVIAGALCTYFVARFAAAWPGRAPVHCAAGLYAFSPGAVIYTSAMMTEPVSAALLCGAIAAAVAHRRSGTLRTAAIAGVLLGVGGLVRPPTLLVAPVLALVCAPERRAKSLARTLLVLGLACCAVVLPWTARNCTQLDGCALVSVNGGSNLWIGADPDAGGAYRDLRLGEGCDGARGEVHKDRCYGRLAWQRIRAHPIAWAMLAPAKLEQLFIGESTPVSYLRDATGGEAFAGREDDAFRGLGAYHFTVLGLALVALLGRGRTGRRAGAEIGASIAAVVALAFVHAVFFGGDRYHFVFLPLLCFLAGGVVRRTDVAAERV